jgi:putative transposase
VDDTQGFRASGNARFRLFVHLVLVTKYRKRILTGPILYRCAAILSDLGKAWDCVVVECSGEADHVHALLDLPPRVRPSDLINLLKTVTSRRLRSEFPALRAAYRGKAVLWSPSYCLLSAGGAPIDRIRRYIENQERPR